jgi:hypothetical protein
MNTVSLEKKKDRQNAALTGVFFIMAAVSSIVGLKLYDPVLTDDNFIISASAHYNQIVWGAVCELILAVTATGTGIMLYPYLKRYNESLGIGYLSFRLLEVVFIVLGTVGVLTVLSVSQHYASHAITDKTEATSIGLAFIALHDWTFILGPNFMLAVNTFLYSYAFRQTGLVPKKLSLLGLVAACLIMIAALLELFGIIRQISLWGVLLALPIAAYELSLAVWLIAKGFKINEQPNLAI